MWQRVNKKQQRSGNVEQERQQLIRGFRFDTYQDACKVTAVYPKVIRDLVQGTLPYAVKTMEEIERMAEARNKIEKLLGIFYVGLGLGEAGEFQNKLKKVLRDNGGVISDEMRAGMRKELGGILWYVAQACTELDLSMGEVALENTEILASRMERGVIQGSGDDR
jgi:NTP pyrophosphatase (non-canonical NTP hydrolase)